MFVLFSYTVRDVHIHGRFSDRSKILDSPKIPSQNCRKHYFSEHITQRSDAFVAARIDLRARSVTMIIFIYRVRSVHLGNGSDEGIIPVGKSVPRRRAKYKTKIAVRQKEKQQNKLNGHYKDVCVYIHVITARLENIISKA